ncbi:MAG TPA: hypothetical protein VE954_43365 [Oligoflexus sp.]|uniref:hypothetical protein n=1 Tax=Oligoflexus sp. TaxID=1971216 RepID=UPI002D7196DF|nr:hypothetical protein [Oligoflexus sp.]HYX39985.1 hypothetical protein [Oligoflexus sp.]
MDYLLIEKSELTRLLLMAKPLSALAMMEFERISAQIMQRAVPPDTVGFAHKSKTPDGKLTLSLFPKEWSQVPETPADNVKA